MGNGYLISAAEAGPLEAIRGILKSALTNDLVHAVMAPLARPGRDLIMPALVRDPELLNRADPLAPCFPLNAARMVSRLTRREQDDRIAVVLRPCEVRAFWELAKIKQAESENVIIIGLDCLGAYDSADFASAASSGWTDDDSINFLAQTRMNPEDNGSEPRPASACRVCEHFTPTGADVLIGLWGGDPDKELWIQGLSPKGETFLSSLELPAGSEPSDRTGLIRNLTEHRTSERDSMFKGVEQVSSGLEKLDEYFSRCVSCYNCRNACPVCYCRQCVFTTDVFDHEPRQYMLWAERKGAVGLPSDKVFYHLTRMVHMSLSCVGCGQCSNACPNDIPVMEIFRTAAHGAQAAFDYQAGLDPLQPPPLSVFYDKEFEDVVG